MALASKTAGSIHDKTGADRDKLKDEYDANHLNYLATFPNESPIISSLMYQIQLMQEDIDELRRYIVSAELLLPDTMGDSLPTSDPRSAGQLWNSSGIVKVSR